eukprot:m.243462 g.243462  ORF g.243462 m.243462 type:complete len:65 (+) comp26608_c0_seq4:26-220(+)
MLLNWQWFAPQVSRVKEELEQELSVFDPAFFEEIEDLKFKYQESVRQNEKYEIQLHDLERRLGI